MKSIISPVMQWLVGGVIALLSFLTFVMAVDFEQSETMGIVVAGLAIAFSMYFRPRRGSGDE